MESSVKTVVINITACRVFRSILLIYTSQNSLPLLTRFVPSHSVICESAGKEREGKSESEWGGKTGGDRVETRLLLRESPSPVVCAGFLARINDFFLARIGGLLVRVC